MSEAAEVGKTAATRTGEVTEVVGEQAKHLVSETGAQARHLLREGVDQLREQASEGQHKLAGGLRSLADQLRQMSERSDGSGMAADLMQQVSERTSDAASWLESREPGDLVNEVRRFARQRPGMFLAGAAMAGAVVGRLTRNVLASSQSTESDPGQQHDGTNANGRPGGSAHPVTPTAPPHTAAVTPAVGEPRQQAVPAGPYGTNPVLP